MQEMLDKVENELIKNTEQIKSDIKVEIRKDLKNIIIFRNFQKKQELKHDLYKQDIASEYNSLDI